MEEIKAMERIYKMLKQNFDPWQIKRILSWLENKLEEERTKLQEDRRREEVVRDRRFSPTITGSSETGANHTGVDTMVGQSFRTD